MIPKTPLIMKRHFTKIKKIIPVILSILFLSQWQIASAKHTINKPIKSDTKFFDTDELIELTLSMDMKAIYRDVGDDPSYHPATLSYIDKNNGKTISMPVKVRARGHFRKDPCNCNFPPLKIDFLKEYTPNTIFAGEKKLKLVTHCQNRRDKYQQYLLQEYLIYKSYNIITDKSYKVRLVKMRYEDVNARYNPIQKFAFFIEKTGDMAKRLGGDNLKVKNVPQFGTNQKYMVQLSIFQFMIGNTDWSVPNLHNIKLVSPGKYKQPIPVPYDFDWSGIMNTEYAKPSPNLNISTVRERLYRGYTDNEARLQPVFNHFNQVRDDIFSLYNHFPYLDKNYKKAAIAYLEEFYKVINNPHSIQYQIVNSARHDLTLNQ